MKAISNLAVLDIVLVVAMAVGSLDGLRIGALRQFVSLGILYVSVVFTTRFYQYLVARVARFLPGAPMSLLEGVLFGIVLLFTYGILSVLILSAAGGMRRFRHGGYDWRRPQEPVEQSVLGTVNHVAGIVVGFGMACLWLGLGIYVYRFMLESSWLDWEDYRYLLRNDYLRSTLAPVFLRFLPYALRTIEPWFPEGLPGIFMGF